MASSKIWRLKLGYRLIWIARLKNLTAQVYIFSYVDRFVSECSGFSVDFPEVRITRLPGDSCWVSD